MANQSPANTHVIVGMSGGVDSSVAALQLLEQGFRVSGIFMQNWEDDDEHCTARQDYRDAAAVATLLDIPLSTVNFSDEYWQRVFAHFLEEYSAGRTPNPDILCNKEIKFRAFLDYARRQGADAIATGHYARIQHCQSQNAPVNGTVLPSATTAVNLLRGLDNNKDQSYFLYTLGQEQLRSTLFPLGDMTKPQVRTIAQQAGIHVHAKKDSTGICFIGERKFSTFLADFLPAKPGPIVNEAGTQLAEHNGLMFYTLGQRQGLGIGGRQLADDSPWYVLDKHVIDNTLVVGQGHNHPRLFTRTLTAHDMHWVSSQPPARRFLCTAKIRYRQPDQAVTVRLCDNDRIDAEFVEPVRAITPGQSIVLYDGERCLGGGVIGNSQ